MTGAPLRTRIKVCGLTRRADVAAAVAAGADAIGLVFYRASPRCVTPSQAAALVAGISPLVSVVGLFVAAQEAEVGAALAAVRLDLLQFHGDEPAAECERYGVPYMPAARVRAGLDLLEFERSHPKARALLVDAYVDGYGGGGKVFDWSLIPEGLALPLVLSGGLNAQNVAEAVRRVRPYAVDVSSGVESAKGIKDAVQIRRFAAAVASADRSSPPFSEQT